MGLDSCLGDVGFTRSKKAVCFPVGDHPQFLFHMCSLTFTLASQTFAMRRKLNLLLPCIPKGGRKWGKNSRCIIICDWWRSFYIHLWPPLYFCLIQSARLDPWTAHSDQMTFHHCSCSPCDLCTLCIYSEIISVWIGAWLAAVSGCQHLLLCQLDSFTPLTTSRCSASHFW